MIWKKLLGGRAKDDSPYLLYRQLVNQARLPVFYTDFGVPDTVEGRFEMVALHAVLTMRRLKRASPEARAFGQRIFDVMFDDMDQAMREMGVSDLRVGDKIRALAEAYFGRIAAYEDGLGAADDALLLEVVARNVYGEASSRREQITAMARYMRACDALLSSQDLARLMKGEVRYPVPVPPVLEGDAA
ncbi:MAG: ubiquinol-cytochrome C chaperone family protein [Parvibaculum sp.]